jgi:NADPH2:quinone reductase
MSTMRALVMEEPFDGAERTAVREVPPPRPREGEVAIDVAYAGVNFIDVMARRGDPGYASAWPFVPGLEVAGAVREIGPGVDGVAVGQRVAALTGAGGLAEVAIAPASLVAAVPDGVRLSIAATAPAGLVTAWLLLSEVARVRKGDRVLVHSASGGVGHAVAALAPQLGAGQLLGTVGRPEKIDAALASGYNAAFLRDDTTVPLVREHTGGAGVDAILDPLGTLALELDVEVAAAGARIVLFGNASGAAPSPLLTLPQLIGGNITVAGFSLRGLAAGASDRVGHALAEVMALLGDGVATPSPIELESLEDVPRAHQLLATGAGSGKYVARIREIA